MVVVSGNKVLNQQLEEVASMRSLFEFVGIGNFSAATAVLFLTKMTSIRMIKELEI